jgi:hypothetical protein
MSDWPVCGAASEASVSGRQIGQDLLCLQHPGIYRMWSIPFLFPG